MTRETTGVPDVVGENRFQMISNPALGVGGRRLSWHSETEPATEGGIYKEAP